MIPEEARMNEKNMHDGYHHHQPPQSMNQSHSIKIVLLGDVQVGKTSLIQRFIANQLPGIYIPTGFDKYSAEFEVGGHHFYANIWDTSGSPAYDTVRPLVYEDTDVFLLCFNLGDWYSLYNVIHKWYPEIRKYTSKPNVPVVLIGCQNDQRFIETTPTTEDDLLRDRFGSPFNNLINDGNDLDECKRRMVYSEEAMEASRQIAAITYVETCSYNPLTVREAFEVAALASNGKLMLQPAIGKNAVGCPPASKTSSPFYGLKHFISLSTSSTTVSSPTTCSNSFDGGSSSSSASCSSNKLKSSSSSTHLTRNRSLFKLRKCKSKSDVKHLNSNSVANIIIGNNSDASCGGSYSNSDISKKSCIIM